MEEKKYTDLSGAEPLTIARQAALELLKKQGKAVKLFCVKDTTVIADYYLIAGGRSSTHVKALADELSLASLALGGSLDIYAGKLRRAPRLFRALGLEWLYRMLREPRRFRGVVTLVRFAFDLLRLKREKRACNRHKRGL